MVERQTIKPAVLDGASDFLPRQMMRRNAVFKTIRGVFERFGYAPIETATLQPMSALNGADGEGAERARYFVTRDAGAAPTYALPSDLTVPFARFVATHYDSLTIPFKRYQIQRVWRDRDERRRNLREFYHCDIDAIGSDDLICEAEIVKIIVIVFDELKIPDISVKFNSRALLKSLLGACGVQAADLKRAMLIVNQNGAGGLDATAAELSGMGVERAADIAEALQMGATNAEALNRLARFEGASDLRRFLDYCERLGVPERALRFAPTLTRDLSYYTGVVFEAASAINADDAICAGGRYDNLHERFSAKRLSGVGAAFEFEKIMDLYERFNPQRQSVATTKALIANQDADDKRAFLKLYRELQEANIAVEAYLQTADLEAQVKYARAKRIPFVLMRGRNAGETIVRRVKNNKDKTIPTQQVGVYLSNYYEARPS